MKRLTTDEPAGNFEGLMNFCYDKKKEAYLRYAGGEDDIELVEYTVRCCKERGCAMDVQEIKADIMDCDCPIAAMYNLGVQAVEMRGRLKRYEDLEEQGQLVELPCKVGDTVWVSPNNGKSFHTGQIFGQNECGSYLIFVTDKNTSCVEYPLSRGYFYDWFAKVYTEAEAMAKLEEMKK